MLTVREAADAVSLTQWAIYRAIHRGDLTAFKPGGRLRIRESDLDAWLESTRVHGSARATAPRRAAPVVVVQAAMPVRAPDESLRARVRPRRGKGAAR